MGIWKTEANFHTTDDLLGAFVYPWDDPLAIKHQLSMSAVQHVWKLIIVPKITPELG